MATSGSWDYSVTALQVITSAAEDIGVAENGQSLDSNDLATMLRTLNLLVKQWQGTSDKFPGLKVWTRQRLVIFPVAAQVRYLVGPAAGDDRASVNSLSTTSTAAKAANATALVVSSTAGMTAADVLGIVTDAGPIGWTTITTVTDSTNLVLAANSIGAAASGKVVYTYTSKAQRFVEIESASLRDNSSVGQPIDTPLAIYTDVQQYEALVQKLASGDPTAMLVEPQRLNTVLTFNFAPANTYKTMRATVIYPSEDYDAAAGSDDIAYPQEYFAALEWELAFRCAPKFGKPWTPGMKDVHEAAVKGAVFLNPGNTSRHFQPGLDSGLPE